MDNQDFILNLLEGNNNPPNGFVVFDSSDHIRYQNGTNVSGHNYNCHRRFTIEKNVSGLEGYTVTLYNLDSIHPVWRDNIQMHPKRMRITSVDSNIVEMRGYGYDENAVAMGASLNDASFENYGVVLLVEDGLIKRMQLNMYDRCVSIVYLQ
jgi:hypothetical protein